MPVENDEMYTLVCKSRFDKMEKKQDEVLDLLRGKGDAPGLVDQVRKLDRAYKAIIGAIVFIISAFIVAIIRNYV